MENKYMNNVFDKLNEKLNVNEIYIKSKTDYKMFTNYFHQGKDEYSIHNSFQFYPGKFFISGFGLINLMHDYKINFNEIEDNEKFILLKLNEKCENELNEIIEFYRKSNHNNFENHNYIISNNDNTLESTNELKVQTIKLEYIVVVKSLLHFYERYSTYFTDIDNYFQMKEILNRLGCSCFLILSNNDNSRENAEKINSSINKSIKNNENIFSSALNSNEEIHLGEDIFALSSSLSVLSYPHFSNSFSKGIISNLLTKDILLLDLRVLPNSHGAIIFNKLFNPIAVILPVLNVKYSYTPIIYSLRISSIFEILKEIYKAPIFNSNSNLRITTNNNSFQFDKIQIKIEDKLTNLKDSVFIIYNSKNYASCFYLGKGYFITNKHFFNNYEIDNEEVYVKNYKFVFLCKKVFIPKNNLDLAIVKIRNYKTDSVFQGLRPIKIYEGKVSILQQIYCVSFSYFDRREILNELKLPNIFKGIISNKIVTTFPNKLHNEMPSGYKNNFDMIYGVDCACYSGGSGGPIVDSNGELIGVLFQNLTFHTEEHFLQLPNSGFILSKEIVSELLNKLLSCNNNLQEDLNSLWICKIPNEKMDKYLNFYKFNPKF